MPRLVEKFAHGPVQVGGKDICMCGLSKNQPFCDQSHEKTLDEDPAKLYVYDEGGREEVVTVPDGENACGGGCCGGSCCEDSECDDQKVKVKGDTSHD
jgi:CDGSH iron-sulfur domain-containing protein 3